MMDKLTGLCVLLLVLNVAAVTPVYFTNGGDLTLKVRPPLPDHINIIVWIYNDNLLAEWEENLVPLSYDLRIKGRANLTKETGQLIINNMSKEDEGVYSVGINNGVQSESYRATLIKKVQKPKVVLKTFTFRADSKSCKFSCDSDTTEAEPITYSWKKGDGEWEVSGKDIVITRTEDSGVKTFTCRMVNPVSRKESDPEPNPLYKDEPSVVGPAIGGLLGALGGCVGVGLLVARIMKICPSPSDSATNTAENIPLQAYPENPMSDAIETA